MERYESLFFHHIVGTETYHKTEKHNTLIIKRVEAAIVFQVHPEEFDDLQKKYQEMFSSKEVEDEFVRKILMVG